MIRRIRRQDMKKPVPAHTRKPVDYIYYTPHVRTVTDPEIRSVSARPVDARSASMTTAQPRPADCDEIRNTPEQQAHWKRFLKHLK